MNLKTLSLSALFAGVNADISANFDSVVLYANTMSALVSAFKTSDGVPIAAQQSFYPLKSAVLSLSSSLQSADKTIVNDGLVQKVVSLETAVAGLMDILAKRAADLNAVYALAIVKGDITDLYAPSIGIASKLMSLADGNCAALSAVAPGLSSMDAGFSKNAPLYSYSATAFPTIPTCAASSSAAPSSSSVAPTTKPTTSSSVAPSTSAKPATSSSSSSTPKTSSSTTSKTSSICSDDKTTSKAASATTTKAASTTSYKRCIAHPVSGPAYTSTYLA